MPTPNLFAEIIPGESAAGFYLGQSIDEFAEVITKASRWNRSSLQLGQAIDTTGGWLFVEDSELRSPGLERVYEGKDIFSGRTLHFGKGAVRLHFDRDGLIDYIAVSEGYKGLLYSVVGIGDELNLVLHYFELEYDDVEEMHFPLEDNNSRLISFYAEEQSLSASPKQRIHSVFITRT